MSPLPGASAIRKQEMIWKFFRTGGPIRSAVMLLVFWIALAPASAGNGPTFGTKAKSAILMEAETGLVLFQKNADLQLPPASLSKLVTLAVIFRALRDKRLELDTPIKVSEYAWRTGGAPSRSASMFVPVHSTETAETLIRGILVQSGNDASIALAEALAGSEQGFTRLMADEARAIGLHNSVFANATGLDAPDQLTTARDVAKVSRFLIREYPEYYPLFAQRELTYRKHRFINRNPLLHDAEGVDGLKTGYTASAGYNFAVTAVRSGRRLIAVLLGCPTSVSRAIDGRKILDWGFGALTTTTIFEKHETVGYARVWAGEKYYVPLLTRRAISIPRLKSASDASVFASIAYKSPLKPPVAKGETVATLRIGDANGGEFSTSLIAGETVAKAGIVAQGLDSLAIRLGRMVGL